jgi:DNA repair protein RadC
MAIGIADLPDHERPRERLIRHGAGALSELELLAIVLRSGAQAVSALDLAASLLADYGSLAALSAAQPEELAARTGIGPAKATAVLAALQLGRRRTVVDDGPIVLRNLQSVAEVARHELESQRRERVLVLACDTRNRLLRTVIVSEGAVDRSIVPVREILNAVLRHDGRAFAIAHNHPGGEPEPSEADRRATAEVGDAARVVGLRFLGHVLIARRAWTQVVT